MIMKYYNPSKMDRHWDSHNNRTIEPGQIVSGRPHEHLLTTKKIYEVADDFNPRFVQGSSPVMVGGLIRTEPLDQPSVDEVTDNSNASKDSDASFKTNKSKRGR